MTLPNPSILGQVPEPNGLRAVQAVILSGVAVTTLWLTGEPGAVPVVLAPIALALNGRTR